MCKNPRIHRHCFMTDTGVLGKIYEIETGASKGIHRKNNFLRQIQEHPRISIDRLERQENPDIKNYKSIRRQNFKTDYRSTQILRNVWVSTERDYQDRVRNSQTLKRNRSVERGGGGRIEWRQNVKKGVSLEIQWRYLGMILRDFGENQF